MPAPRQITSPKQLVVEGKDAVGFFEAFLQRHGFHEFQIQDFGGVNELGSFLKALQVASDFDSQNATLAVIRDSESDHIAAFQSACSALVNAGLPVPRTPEVIEAGPPRVGVFLLPDPQSSGMLETLCNRAAAGDPLWPCVDQFLDCVRRTGSCPSNLDKARFHAFLATRPRPGLPIALAAKAGYISLQSNEFQRLRSFLASL